MKRRAPLLVLFLGAASLLASACESTPAPPPKHQERVRVTPEVVSGLEDLVRAHHELRLFLEPEPARGRTKQALETLKAEEDAARERLVTALEFAGSTEARSAPRQGGAVDAIALRALARSRRYAFVLADGDDSVAIVRLARDSEERKVRLFDEDVGFELFVFDETVVDDYPTYRARKLAPGAASGVIRPAFLAGKTDEQGKAVPNARAIYLDVAAIESVGQGSFFARIDALKKTAQDARQDGFFANQPDLQHLLEGVKDVLRWRSLESFWSTVQLLPREEQNARFVQDYEARALVAAAAQLRELQRAHEAGLLHPAGDRLVAVERRAMLSAIIHGEPLGATANAAGLAAAYAGMQGGAGGAAFPGLKAAVNVMADLSRELAQAAGAQQKEGDDARLARLARASADDLRAAAKAVYAKPWPQAPAPPPPAPVPAPGQSPPR